MKANSKRASAQNVSPVLKCRKGDLAIRLDNQYAGQIVEIVEYRGATESSERCPAMRDAWKVLHPTYESGWTYFCEDKYLIPIRPGDLEETEADELGQEERDAQGAQHG